MKHFVPHRYVELLSQFEENYCLSKLLFPPSRLCIQMYSGVCHTSAFHPTNSSTGPNSVSLLNLECIRAADTFLFYTKYFFRIKDLNLFLLIFLLLIYFLLIVRQLLTLMLLSKLLFPPSRLSVHVSVRRCHTSAFHPINSSRCLNSLIKDAPYVLEVDPWGPRCSRT